MWKIVSLIYIEVQFRHLSRQTQARANNFMQSGQTVSEPRV